MQNDAAAAIITKLDVEFVKVFTLKRPKIGVQEFVTQGISTNSWYRNLEIMRYNMGY